jgi:hypothetical protein
VVEASEAGARTLGVTYWQAVDRFTRGVVHASWTGGGGKLKMLGGPTLLTFGPPELSFDGGLVSSGARVSSARTSPARYSEIPRPSRALAAACASVLSLDRASCAG